MTDYTSNETGLHASIDMRRLCVRGLSSNPDPRAIKLLESHLRDELCRRENLDLCRRLLAQNSSKEAIRLFTQMYGYENDIPLLCANPSKPAIMFLMDNEKLKKKIGKFIDWNAIFNNPCELAKWWVSIKTKSTPNMFRNCRISEKTEKTEKLPDPETDLYTLAAREDDDALVIIESFITGSWTTWFDEGSKMKPIVEREWNAARGDERFWKILCANQSPRILKFIFLTDCIHWETLSANPVIFAKVE